MRLTHSPAAGAVAIALLAAIYFLTAKLALDMAEHGYASPFWPPSGISVAALLLGGLRLLPGVFLGAFLVNWQVDQDSLLALQVAMGNSLEAFLLAWLVKRYVLRCYFLNYSRHLFAFTAFAALAAAIGACIGAHAVTDWHAQAAWSQFSRVWTVWWLGDLVGILVFTPLMLSFAQRYAAPPRRWREKALYTAAIVLVVQAVFGGWTPIDLDNAPFAFLPLPLLIAISYRFSLRGCTLTVLYLTLAAINGTLAGYGPFVSEDIPQSLLLQQVYIGCIALSGLLLCSVIHERERARQALQRLSRQLEKRVEAATIELRNNNHTLRQQQQAQQLLIEELRTSEGRYRALFENAPEAVVLFSLSRNKFIDVNDNALKLFGRSRAKMLQLSLKDVSPLRQANGDSSEMLARRYLARALSGSKECFEWLHLDANGDLVPCEVRLTPFPSRQDQLVRGSITNIRERLEAEERQRLTAKLFENTAEAVIITDCEQRIIQVNDAFRKISGYSADEVLGQTPKLFASGRHSPGFFREMWHSLHTEGRWQGEIWDRRKNGESYPKWLTISEVRNDNGRVTHYLGQFTDITENKAKEERLLQLAITDHLTGLYNRTSFLQILDESIYDAKRNGFECAVLFFDLDGFKRVNDSLGHDIGDRLLRSVAERLKQKSRANDTAARLGGDEFTLLVKQSRTDIDLARLADKLLRALAEPYVLDNHTIHLTASLGISRYPMDGKESKELLKNADMAMYRAKHAGRNGYQFYSFEMKAQVQRQMSLEMELRRALAEREFELHYQPQVDLISGRIISVEALIRWQHPSEGLRYPGYFIDVAEQSGLICQIGNWVLQHACQQAKQWQQRHNITLPVAVNLSAKQFQHPKSLLQQVDNALASSGLAPQLLELEITESMLLDNVEEALETLSALRTTGIRVAIDDFGTGYSSLAYLKQFAADKLKIDRSFVRDLEHDPDDAAIVQATIALGHSLGLKVMAEGVENAPQKAFLTRLGCDQIQGFYIAPALAADALLEFVAAHPVAPISRSGDKASLN